MHVALYAIAALLLVNTYIGIRIMSAASDSLAALQAATTALETAAAALIAKPEGVAPADVDAVTARITTVTNNIGAAVTPPTP